MDHSCPQCSSPAKGKFCGVCGFNFTLVSKSEPEGTLCVTCGARLAIGTKFCGGCGSKAATETAVPATPVDLVRLEGGAASGDGVVSWNFFPGEVARRISSEEILEIAKGGAKAFAIAEGQRALIYVDGVLATEMGAGRHPFLAAEEERKLEQAYSRRTGGLVGALEGVGSAIGRFIFGSSRKEQEEAKQDQYDRLRAKIGKSSSVSVVLARSAPFLTQHLLRNVRTKNLTANVAVTLRVSLGDVKAVYASLMADRSLVRQSDLEAMLFSGENGSGGYLGEFVSELAAYTMEELTNSAEARRALSLQLQGLSPEFLRVLQLTSISANREDLERVRQEREASIVAEQELENLVATNRLCNRFQLEVNRRSIEEARNGEELATVLQKVNSDKLLREEQATVLLREIEGRAEDHQVNRAQALRMLRFQQEFDYQKDRLKYEEEVTNRQLAIERQRAVDQAAHQLELERARASFEHDEDLRDLDVLRKMQEVKNEQTQREHERSVQAFTQANSHQLEMMKQFAGMTAEQILVANPNLTPAQASAMAEMAKAKAEVSQKDDRVELMREMQVQQQEMMGRFMQTMTGAMGAVNQAKEAELSRTIESTDKSEERLMRVVNTTVSAMKGGEERNGGFPANRKAAPQGGVTCPKCDARTPAGSKFCTECGEVV